MKQKNYEKEIHMKEALYQLPDLKYEATWQIIIDGLWERIYGCHYNDGNMD